METNIFLHSPELGSLLYSLYKIPLAQVGVPLARPHFHSHWRAGERYSFPAYSQWVINYHQHNYHQQKMAAASSGREQQSAIYLFPGLPDS